MSKALGEFKTAKYDAKCNNSRFETLFPHVQRNVLVEPEFERQFLAAALTQSQAAWKGEPGVGKTESVVAVCKKYGFICVRVLLSLYDYQDIQGYPTVAQDKLVLNDKEYPYIVHAPMHWVVDAARKTENNIVVVFIDELVDVTPQQAVLGNRVIHERQFGEIELPANRVVIVGAYNPASLSAMGGSMRITTASRLDLYEYKPNFDFFAQSYPSYFGQSDEIKFDGFTLDPVSYTWARAMVVDFLTRSGDSGKFHQVPKEEAKREEPFPCPRNWDYAARKLALIRQLKLNIEEALPLMYGRVGGVAADAMAFISDQDLRDPEEVLQEEVSSFNGFATEDHWRREKPSAFKIDKRGDRAFGLLSSIQAAALRTPADRARYVACWRILKSAADANGKDVAFAAASEFINHSKKVVGKMPSILDEIIPFEALLEGAGKWKRPHNKTKAAEMMT